MERLTKKERLELESVFAMIYTKKESKFVQMYKEFCHLSLNNLKNIKKRLKKRELKNA